MMGSPLRNWSVAALTVACAVVTATQFPSAQNRDTPKQVVQKAEQIRAAIETRPRIGDVVASEDARPYIARIIKRYRRAAAAWQLDPAVVREVNDAQIADFVVARAQHILACTDWVWTRVSLEKGFDAQPDVVKQIQSELTPSATSGNYGVGPDCVTLINQSGEPIVIRRAADLTQALAFERAFAQTAALRLSKAAVAQNPSYRANVAYFTKQFAAGLTEDRGFAQAIQKSDAGIAADTRVYRFSMTNLSFYISYDQKARSQLIFIAPFSW